jgi:hypothetical protein
MMLMPKDKEKRLPWQQTALGMGIKTLHRSLLFLLLAIALCLTPAQQSALWANDSNRVAPVTSSAAFAEHFAAHNGAAFASKRAHKVDTEERVLSLVAADVEPDGDVDVFASYFQSPTFWVLWLNDGQGGFTRGPTREFGASVWQNTTQKRFNGIPEGCCAAGGAASSGQIGSAILAANGSWPGLSSVQVGTQSALPGTATVRLRLLIGCLSRRGPPVFPLV